MNSQSYRLVVTDVRMPKMNGFEFASNVREINPKVKIVLMSAFELSDVEYSAALHSLKIDGFLRKPVEIPTLIKEVRDTVTG